MPKGESGGKKLVFALLASSTLSALRCPMPLLSPTVMLREWPSPLPIDALCMHLQLAYVRYTGSGALDIVTGYKYNIPGEGYLYYYHRILLSAASAAISAAVLFSFYPLPSSPPFSSLKTCSNHGLVSYPSCSHLVPIRISNRI
ncbi:hypothetical protein F5Y09DRAFT_160936 [Xylaria sp. FL1042]|nr:hypothetical protein F5Y09DRAFT_160936 [Xylaria sp. FL1042]